MFLQQTLQWCWVNRWRAQQVMLGAYIFHLQNQLHDEPTRTCLGQQRIANIRIEK